MAIELDKKDEAKQVNTLIYTMGDEGDDILLSFNLSPEDLQRYDVVKNRFENHFIAKRNVIYERAKFNVRIQNDSEPVEAFITDLHCLAEHCEFGTLKCKYAQIEKEALAVTWACERSSNYVLGKSITIETDHKPLVPLLMKHTIDR